MGVHLRYGERYHTLSFFFLSACFSNSTDKTVEFRLSISLSKLADSRGAFYALPDDVLFIVLGYIDNLVDLQNFVLSSSHIWRYFATAVTTSSAIQATTLQCIIVYAERFGAMGPLEATELIDFDLYSDTLDDLPDGPRYRVSKPSQFTWDEEQCLLKAFWMVYVTRSLFKKLNQGGLDWPADQVAKASSLRAIDVFQFSRHSVCHTLFKKRPRDYLLSALHIYLSAEEFLEENRTMPSIEVQSPCRKKQDSDDDDDWLARSAPVSETMEHFVRLFKEAC